MGKGVLVRIASFIPAIWAKIGYQLLFDPSSCMAGYFDPRSLRFSPQKTGEIHTCLLNTKTLLIYF